MYRVLQFLFFAERGANFHQRFGHRRDSAAAASSRGPAVAMGDLSVDPVTFWERLSKLHKMWNVRPAERGNCGHMRK